MELQTLRTFCSRCAQPHDFQYAPSASPALRDKILDGSLFTWNCPSCGAANLASYPFLYHDAGQKLMLVLTNAALGADSLPDGYTGRIVRSVGDLVEKVKIFDAGLDDIVVEMVKMITRKELGKDVSLKFLKMDGADAEMTFTYPSKDSMEMIVTGFNVYEDCAGILQRNPHIREAARGLVTVDQGWLLRFFE